MLKKILILLLISCRVYSLDIDKSMTGSWFDQSNSGQGINIEILSDNRILVYWYAYDQGNPLWLTGVGTYQGDTAQIELSQFNGSEFGVDHKTSLVASNVFGNLTISFDSCDKGNMVYDSIQGLGSGSIPLNRLTSVLGVPCTTSETSETPAAPFSQKTLNLEGVRIRPKTCNLIGDQLTCEFDVTSLDSNVVFLLSPSSNANINGSVFRTKSITLGSSTSQAGAAVKQSLTKGIPVIGNVVFNEVPFSTQILNLLQLRALIEKRFIVQPSDLDFFDAVVINNN